MVTSKQAEEFRFAITGGGLLGGVMPTGTDVVALCTTVINTERDAALGAACRTAVADGETEYGVDFALVAADPSATEATDAFARDVFDAISAHIREEQKGAP